MVGRRKKKKVYVEQTKSTVIFTHSPNKCHNIFRKYLFLVVISHNFIFYYFMLTYKKLTDLEKKKCSYGSKLKKKKKKKKDKGANQNETVDEQLYEQYKNTVEKKSTNR